MNHSIDYKIDYEDYIKQARRDRSLYIQHMWQRIVRHLRWPLATVLTYHILGRRHHAWKAAPEAPHSEPTGFHQSCTES